MSREGTPQISLRKVGGTRRLERGDGLSADGPPVVRGQVPCGPPDGGKCPTCKGGPPPHALRARATGKIPAKALPGETAARTPRCLVASTIAQKMKGAHEITTALELHFPHVDVAADLGTSRLRCRGGLGADGGRLHAYELLPAGSQIRRLPHEVLISGSMHGLRSSELHCCLTTRNGVAHGHEVACAHDGDDPLAASFLANALQAGDRFRRPPELCQSWDQGADVRVLLAKVGEVRGTSVSRKTHLPRRVL